MKKSSLALFAFGLLAFSACDPTPRPDYTIRVTPTAQGSIATPPACPSWASDTKNPFDEQPDPQFGCANARNLALMAENPNDIVEGRDMGNARGVTEVGAIRRYDNNQARGLIWPGQDTSETAKSTSYAPSSNMTGDVTGGAGAPASSAGAPAASP
ncbi:MAG: CpaD family pilus assembly lipoprotein [Alphaproteobacteria bacterium]